jgi:putative ABC transport system permease protein
MGVMRVRLRHERLQSLLASSPLSQNHWALKLGLSRGHWSDLVNGRHPFPSAKTRERMLDVFGVAANELFEEVENQSEIRDLDFRMGIATRYTILKEIGQGGMGTVYLATDLRHHRNVALKVVAPEAAGGIGNSAILKEIALVSRLHHPNILPLYDSGETAGQPWFVMPWVEGGSLRDLFARKRRLAIHEALPIIRGIADALAHAHDHGVLHCDVKPANVLLYHEHPFVMDFGIARRVHREADEWASVRRGLDFSAGTPAYVSPEQASGERTLDGRSDLYSLGCVAFEMLAGHPPFEGDTTRRVVSRRFLEPPPSLTSHAPGISEAIADVVQRAMSRRRDHRQPSLRHFVAEVGRAVGGITGFRASVPTKIARITNRFFSTRGKTDSMMHDIRFATRSIRREPLFAAFVVMTLALGVGANVAMFGITERLLLRRPAHIVEPQRLVRFYQRYRTAPSGEQTSKWLSFTLYENLRTEMQSVDGIAAVRVLEAPIGEGRDTRMLSTAWVSANFFPVLGVHPKQGRFFTEDENQGDADDDVAVISEGIWHAVFGSDSTVIGRSVEVEGIPYTIVGIAPRGFTGVEVGRIDVWVPLHTIGMCRGSVRLGCTTVNWNLIGRLKSGTARARAGEEATAVHRRTYDGSRRELAEARMIAAPIWYNDVGEEPGEATVARWLVGVSVVVLVIACANVINLLLARAMRRRREMAVRLALGAGRGRLIRLLLAEAVVLATVAGVASLAVAWLTGRFVRRVLLPNVEWVDGTIDVRMLVITGALALSAGVIVGLVPALQSSGRGMAGALKIGTGAGGGHRSRLRALLTIAQAALSVVLLVGAGLFVRSLWKLEAIDLGLEPDRVVTATMQVDEQATAPIGNASSPAMAAIRRERPIYDRALDAVRKLEGVEAASLTVGLPFVSNFSVSLGVPGFDSLPRSSSGSGGRGPFISAVTRDYFTVIGTPILRGHGFTDADREGSEPVTIVSASMAQALWADRDPIGQCLVIGDHGPPCSRVVGVAADVHRNGFREDRSWQYYVPFGQERELGIGGTILIIRPRGNPERIWAALRRELQDVDPSVGYVDLNTLESALEPEIRPWRLGASVFALCGVLALLVAAVGLYSVMSYLVARRTHEIGVRVALGATGRAIAGLILRTGSALAGGGVVIGLTVSVVAGRFLEPLLFETSPRDIVVLAVAAGTILAVALLAGVLPARRATRVNPVTALRAE